MSVSGQSILFSVTLNPRLSTPTLCSQLSALRILSLILQKALILHRQQFFLSLCNLQGGKSGQHRVPYFLTGRSRQLREQKVPQKITATPQAW
jgi:hypothetical protein